MARLAKFSVVDENKIQLKIDPKSAPLSKNLGVLGLNGITAYAGLIDICKPKKMMLFWLQLLQAV